VAYGLVITSFGGSLAFGLACGAASRLFVTESDRAVHSYYARMTRESPRKFLLYEYWTYYIKTVAGSYIYKGTWSQSFTVTQTRPYPSSLRCWLRNYQRNFHLYRTCLKLWDGT
jgi:hypothetical protein